MIAFLLVAFLASPLPAETAPQALLQFLELPVKEIGNSVQDFTRKLGDPERASFELHENLHEPKMQDVRARLIFKGFQATVLVAVCCDKSILESFRIERSAAVSALRWNIPSTAAEAQKRFGSPSERTPKRMIYRIENEVGVDTITLSLRGGTVTDVEWQYFID